jgi:hypothetical protein
MSEFGELLKTKGYTKNYTNDNIYFYTKSFENKYSISVYEYDFRSMSNPHILHPYNGPDFRYDVRTEFETNDNIYLRISFGLDSKTLNVDAIQFIEQKCADMFIFAGGVS